MLFCSHSSDVGRDMYSFMHLSVGKPKGQSWDKTRSGPDRLRTVTGEGWRVERSSALVCCKKSNTGSSVEAG